MRFMVKDSTVTHYRERVLVDSVRQTRKLIKEIPEVFLIGEGDHFPGVINKNDTNSQRWYVKVKQRRNLGSKFHPGRLSIKLHKFS